MASIRTRPLRVAALIHRRGFAVSIPRHNLTAQQAAERLMTDFGGKTSTRSQLLDGNQLQKLALTLNRPLETPSQSTPPNGTPIPAGYHLVYFTPSDLETSLGRDGTDRTFNAPSPFTRRMWAGGKMTWEGSGLKVGDEVTEHTRLLSATAKKSRSAGEMVLVEVEKEFWGPSGLAVVDKRSWVFRPEIEEGEEKEVKGLDVDVKAPSEIKDIEVDGKFKEINSLI